MCHSSTRQPSKRLDELFIIDIYLPNGTTSGTQLLHNYTALMSHQTENVG